MVAVVLSFIFPSNNELKAFYLDSFDYTKSYIKGSQVKYNEMIHKDEKLQIEISNTSDSILRCLYYSIHRLSADLIQADILKQNINCSANYVEIYLNNFEFAYSGEKPFFANKKYSSIKPITDIIFCNNHITKTISYHLKQTCNIAIAPQCYPDEKFIDENIINEKIHIYF